MDVTLWAVIGYLAGSFPSTWVVAVIGGRRRVLDDVERTVGEADAHVVLQASSGRSAALAATLDVLKAAVPVSAAATLVDPYAVGACAVGTVAGHCWPPFLFRFAGRGLAATAGAFLGFVPVEMVVAGLVRVAGSLVKAGGLASTVGFAAVPILAWWRGQPLPYVVTAAALNLLIFARRLEGVSDDVYHGQALGRAVARRVVLDASARMKSR